MLGEARAPADAPPLCAGGIETPAVLSLLRGLAAGLREAGAAGPLAWLIVPADEAVGLISLKTARESGVVDIGYGLARAHRGQGHAAAAVALLADMLAADGIPALTAETSVNNRESQRVLERNGFAAIGTRDDPEDGPLILWRRELGGAGK